MTAGQEPLERLAAAAGSAGIPIAPGASEVVYAIGDIHGCYHLLRDLLSQIARDADMLPPYQNITCVFLGDYVDRGPESASVIAALLWLERHAPFDCVFLRGNHEQVMLDYLADPLTAAAWLQFGGVETLQSYGVTVPENRAEPLNHVQLRDALLDLLPAAHLDFLTRLPTRYETKDQIFVHAGLRPGTALTGQVDEDLLWIRDDFLDYEGSFEKLVVYGHTWTSDQPEVSEHRIGLDTGAYETGVLTAARFVGNDVDFLRSTTGTAGKGAPSDLSQSNTGDDRFDT